MIGFVQYYLLERYRNFGFIRYASDPSSDRLDCSVHFFGTETSSIVGRGDKVEFEILTNEKGFQEAVRISLAKDRFGGVVRKAEDGFCFIFCEEQTEIIFAAFDDVAPDIFGSRVLWPGQYVNFRLGRAPANRKVHGDSIRAVDVRRENFDEVVDTSEYREFGQVTFFDGDRGHIQRPSGETLSFLAKNIISEGADEIVVGTWLQYAVDVLRYDFNRNTLQFRHRVFAKNIQVCVDSPEASAPVVEAFADPNSIESQFLAAEELPLAAPEPERVEPGHVYLASERKLSLRELIARRAQAKAA